MNFKRSLLVLTVSLLSVSAFAYTPAARSRGTASLNVLNYGAKPNDTGDDTAAIQRAIDALPSTGGTVYIPAGTYRINANDSTDPTRRGINLRSLMLLKMDAGTILKTIPNSSMSTFYVLNIHQVNDVEVAGGQIIGERSAHIDTRTSSDQKSEWGHGVMIRGSSRVTVRNIRLVDHWGDGISVGAQGSDISVDVVMDNLYVNNNRRNGVTIGRSSSVRLYDSEIAKTNGTDPEYGVDIEPDTTTDAYAGSPRVENCYIHHNNAGGIQIYHKVTNAVIVNNRLEYNQYGMWVQDAEGGIVSGNMFAHNVYQGLLFTGASGDFSVSSNRFHNNSTKAVGLNLASPTWVTYSGYGGDTYSLTRAHVKELSSYPSTYSFGTNYYAK